MEDNLEDFAYDEKFDIYKDLMSKDKLRVEKILKKYKDEEKEKEKENEKEKYSSKESKENSKDKEEKSKEQKDNKEVNKQNTEMSSKEIRFIKRDKLNQSTQFILQHMISGKYISTEMKFNNNKIILKLVNDFESAYLFSFRKINETRSSVELLTYSHIFYLNVYINEEKQFYFVNEESSTDETDINKLYYDIVLSKRPVAQFCIINQTWVINQPNSLYSGQLINIIFSQNINGKEEKFMLGVEEKNVIIKKRRKMIKKKNIINIKLFHIYIQMNYVNMF
jgi:hypothetical protein